MNVHTLLACVAAAVAAPLFAQAPAAVDWEHLGGAATVRDASNNAFGMPAPLLSPQERRAFVVGNSFFKQNWVTAPASTAERDGLGPLFNARSCSTCHFKDGRSRPPEDGEADRSGLLIRIGVPNGGHSDLPHARYGGQIQDAAILGVQPEARVAIHTHSIPGHYEDGTAYDLSEPEYELVDPAYGELGEPFVLGPRTAPQLIGLGLLEAIPAAAIEALADPDDRDGNGISGRAHHIAGQLGRFGWKATQPTVESQAAAAFVNDMGITSRLERDETLSEAERAQISFVSGGAPEIEDSTFDRVVFYTRTLAVPAAREMTSPQVQTGRERFVAFGCASCHTPQFVTEPVAWHASYGNQTIHPFTDLLLHDMGSGLADGKRDGDASPQEWRTPPLWGIGLVPVVNGHSRYLHDGRARNLAEAILWHGGEAERAKERFRTAARADREALLAFLGSL